jgi:hypothetical protein
MRNLYDLYGLKSLILYSFKGIFFRTGVNGVFANSLSWDYGY